MIGVEPIWEMQHGSKSNLPWTTPKLSATTLFEIEDMAELRALISNLFGIVWLLFTFVRYFKFLFVHGC